jgi:nucleoside-diphosphate-sugar epimerase
MAIEEASLSGNPYTGRRVMVTGGTGFIGRYLVAALMHRGAEVRALVRPSTPTPNSWKGVEICRGDLEQSQTLACCCRGTDTIFHVAGFAHAWHDGPTDSADRHWRVNTEGTRRLLDAATRSGVNRFVFFSSVKAMGEGEKRCIAETWPAPPLTAYGRSKQAAERWVLEMGRANAIHVVNLRLAMVYGPGGRGNLERMAAAIRRGIFPPLPEVENKRSMVHVADVVRAALMSAVQPEANQQTYIVTDGHGYSSREIYQAICRALGKTPPRWAVPELLLLTLAKLGDFTGWCLRRRVGFDSETLSKLLGWAWFDNTKICRELGYQPTHALADSLTEIVRGGYLNGDPSL